ncbi:hypothetical protein SAMN05216229_11017 [Geopseudomonas sagittaria]|uniref:MFS transporter permease n=1 Tax=Geopseudomonas sagittaria TaxID=1135990 RepID=A0A1I5V6L1_9GAMM|nr:DUF6064 family protein [Pseudomonas sagittaria]SFQ03090.1 hypothetical protein SAMN05216229_11017 [Pseudomonas sagittaria]
MAEWWLYGPRDLLLFAPRTYYRLFELYNLELWPLQLLALALGLAVLVLARRGGERAGRASAVILVLCWLWVAWGFHWQRYASINLAAGYFALAFVVQAALLLWSGVLRGRLAPPSPTRLQKRAGLVLLLFALLVFPAIGPLLGRSWTQAELFGMAPDPTALATLGVLLLVGGRPAWGLWPIPVAWCLLSGTTLWAMEAPDFALAPLLALLAVGLAVGGAARRSR